MRANPFVVRNLQLNSGTVIGVVFLVALVSSLFSARGQTQGPVPSPLTQHVSGPEPDSKITKQIKDFLSQPPVIAKMIAEVCHFEGTNQEFSCYYVLLRFQTNGFFYREAPALLDLSTAIVFPKYRCGGYYNDEYWNYSGDGMTLAYATNRDPALQQTVEHLQYRASIILNLGLFDLLPHSVVWDGNNIRPQTNSYGVIISGNLELSADLPDGLTVLTDFKGNPVPWRISYDFSTTTSLPRYLPSRIAGRSLRNGGHLLKFEVRMLNVEVTDQPLAKEFFTPQAFSESVMYSVLYTPKGKLFRDKLNKQLRPVAAPTDRPNGNAFVVFMALALVSSTFVIAAVFVNRRRQAAASRKANHQH